jgi:Rieske Fe-S protein
MADQEVDPRLDTPGREGLTGTSPANPYGAIAQREQLTLSPDGRPMGEQPAWRQDFPIDWPEDHYVERREFMKFMVLTSGALTAGQLWIVAQNWLRSRQAPPGERRIASLTDLPVGETLVFGYPEEDDACILVRVSEQELVAYSQKCTHLSCAVIPRPEEGMIHCPCHQGFFDLRSGRPLAGPPRRPLDRVRLELRGEDVFATGIERRTV